MTSIRTLAAAVVLAGAATSVQATQFVVNGDFTDLSNGLGQAGYNTVATGWSTSGYNFVVNQADVGSSGTYGNTGWWDAANYTPGPTGDIGSYYSTPILANPVGNSWNGQAAFGGNFVALDADFNTGPLQQTINNLTVGKTYWLSFSYAFGQQSGFSGDTLQSLTETFGGQTFTSSTQDVPSHGFSGWESFGEFVTATSTSETLSFLATGNLPVPPFAMVSNVSLTAPEPGGWALMIIGVGLVGGAARRRRVAPVTV